MTCGSLRPLVTVAEVNVTLPFVIPPAPACRGSEAEGPAVHLCQTQLPKCVAWGIEASLTIGKLK
jgi:hypothetical protein